MKRWASLLVILLGCLIGAAAAQFSDLGLNPFQTDAGARPLGMGGAFVGLADDVNSLLYNPGGLAWAKGISLSYKDFENITAIQAYPTGVGSSLGLGVVTSKVSDLSSSSGTATTKGSLILLSYGTKLNFIPDLYQNNEALQRIGIGLNFKNIMGETLYRSGLPDRSATGWQMDLGLLWKPEDWWSAGLATQNIFSGNEIRWDVGTPESVPTQAKLAGSARVIGDIGSPIFMEGRELLLGGELDLASAGPALLRLGGEWNINRTYFFRLGLMQQNATGSAMTSLNLGLGWRSENWGADFVSYRDELRKEMLALFSVLYFPREWIVIKRLDVAKPAVILERPFESISIEDNFITYDDKIDVTGKVKANVDVYVDGLRANTAADNTFKVVVPLQIGKNLVMVEARYEGEKKMWKYKVLRKTKIQLAEEQRLKKELEKALGLKEQQALKEQAKQVRLRKEKVEALVTLGVIEVTPEAEFRLEASITRGELATWLAKATGLTLPKVDKDPFTDVKRDDPLAPYIKAAVDWDLLKPYPDGTFRPNAPVSKEEGEKLFKIFGVKK